MKDNITSREWWIAALIRAIKTMAQTAIATIGAAAVLSDVNWLVVGSASLLAGILSILTSIAGLPEVSNKTAEWIEDNEESAEEKSRKTKKSKK